MEKILRQGFEELGLPLSDTAVMRFRTFFSRLEEKNKVMNLTAISGETDTARLHFLDCAALLSFADLRGKTVIDVGTGAGFPGIPLLIACPEIKQMTLLDSQNKRVEFLRECCTELGLHNAAAIQARAEEAKEYREKYDVAVSRAVARLNVLAELSLPFVALGGRFIAMKGPRGAEELSEAERAITVLGGAIDRVETYQIPDTDIRHSLVIVRKLRPTPGKYPRRFAMIKKTPL
ncbi:MAG: 16S rRNA (guanine(527)-N(7))-methyltransferase RsmG [Oscillospiraceae bacterium]